MLSQIVQLVAQAQRSRAPLQRLADRVSYWCVLAALAMSLSSVSVVGNALRLRTVDI